MSPVLISHQDNTTCPICTREFKTLAGLSKHMNSSIHTSVKKDISQIVSEEIPGIRCTFLQGKDGLICHYDADASEEVVQQMVALLDRLNIKCTFERMPF